MSKNYQNDQLEAEFAANRKARKAMKRDFEYKKILETIDPYESWDEIFCESITDCNGDLIKAETVKDMLDYARDYYEGMIGGAYLTGFTAALRINRKRHFHHK